MSKHNIFIFAYNNLILRNICHIYIYEIIHFIKVSLFFAVYTECFKCKLKNTHARVMLLLGSRGTSMTVVPSISTSLQAVVFRPVTRQAW